MNSCAHLALLTLLPTLLFAATAPNDNQQPPYLSVYNKDTYPWPEGTREAEIQSRRKQVWDYYLNADYGLLWWKCFATAHKKPLAIPEWGVNMKPDGHGGLDNVFYVEQMHAFITDPDNNVFFHCYFDVQAPDGGHQLSPGVDGTEKTRFPKSAARFKELFGLP